MSRDIYFNGPAGIIEAKVSTAAGDGNKPAVLILHPDPLQEGSMHSKVVYTMYQAFKTTGFNVMRMNFRGVGRSQGSLQDFAKNPEQAGIADAAAGLDWLHNEFPLTTQYWVAGFSFGSWIAMHLLMRRPEIEGFIAVAPPASHRNFDFLSPCPVSGLFIQPEKDNIAKLEHTNRMIKNLDYGEADVDYKVILNADHFFQDPQDSSKHHLGELYENIRDYINVCLATHISKPIRKKRRRRKKRELEDE